MGLGLRQPALRFVDLCAEAVGQNPGGVLLEVERFEQGPGVRTVTACASRQVAVFAPVKCRAITWVIAQ
ncbi:hypothetical protein ACFVTC_41485 [Streptomyces sp. NPDC057950]|uniref:hypothetical protein n=1 Tax=Streptomyces sp. NPDC057950 TaxID=3346288 RepID=UPI0036EA877F